MLKTTSTLTSCQGEYKKSTFWLSLAALALCRAKSSPVPRAQCHFLRLDTHNIPRRQLANSLRLQLTQLTGRTQTGFAWKVEEGETQLWYWDESPEGIPLLPEGQLPWPEPLLRAPPANGLHLLACSNGVEAIIINDGQLRRSRWWAKMPSETDWANFVRDTGQDPAHFPHTNLRAEIVRTTPNPPKDWRLSSRHLRPTPVWVLGMALIVAIAGMALIAGTIYDHRINDSLREKQAQIARLKQENAATLRLQRLIAEQQTWLETLAQVKPDTFQLLLLKDIADSGLVGGETGVSLAEWEYRSGHLKLLFVVPEEKFNLSDFLAHLEELTIFQEVKLMPDTPPRTIGIQTILARPSKKADEKPAIPLPPTP